MRKLPAFIRMSHAFSHNLHGIPGKHNEVARNIGADLIEWEDRASRAAGLAKSLALAHETTAADLGCGNQTLRKLIPATWKYVPYDYCKRTEDTVLCDFNVAFPIGSFDLAFCLGLLEYLHQPLGFLGHVTHLARFVIVSYNGPTSHHRREKQGWCNGLNFSDIEDVFVKQGGEILRMIEMPKNERIYLFRGVQTKE